MSDLLVIVLVSAATLSVILLLTWRNKRDKKLINPDAQDSVEEAIMDHERRKDKI